MKCAKCGHKSEVMDSRPLTSREVVRRRRRCLSCRHMWKTFEVAAADLESWAYHNRKYGNAK